VSFDVKRIGLPERIVAGGAVALLIFLFLLHWYGGSITGLGPTSHISGGTIDATGWEAFTSSRWIWLGTTVLALGSVLAAAAAYRLDGPVQIGPVVLGMGTLSTILIAYRIVHHPGASASGHGLQISYGIKFGIWLGLLAAIAIAVGGYLQVLAEAKARGRVVRYPWQTIELSVPWRKLSLPSRRPGLPRRRAAPVQAPSEQASPPAEQAFTGLTVSRPKPGPSSTPPDRAG
jgi:hypothetical protein